MGIPEVGDKVSICAGTGMNGIVYCCIEEVRVVKEARNIVNRSISHDRSNWKLFVPWVGTLFEALDVYEALDCGCGKWYLSNYRIERSENIGCKRFH